jgi:hypothetical protein
MRDDRIVSFNLGARRLREARALLSRMALWDSARLEESGPVQGVCMVRLASSDPRLPELLAALRDLGHPVVPRADRTYSKKELDTFSWLRLRVATAGLMGGANLGQPYDFTDACTTCGAGSRPLPPLRIDANRMGQKLLDATAHDGHVVVHQSVLRDLRSAGLTGFEAGPVTHLTGRGADAFAWFQVTTHWHPFERTSSVTIDDPCPSCHRSGHFDCWAEPTELRYLQPPRGVSDIAATYEYLGVWQSPNDRRPVGGQRALLVSRRFRQALIKANVRHLQFDPVAFAA